MTSSFNALRSSDLFYAPQFETAERTIRSWAMFDGEIWNEVIGLFRKICRAAKKLFKKLICSRQEESPIDHRIRYTFADLQSGKSGLALVLCVYNYMWSKEKGLQPVNIIGSCSQLARIPEQFKSDLYKLAEYLDCYADNIVSQNNIVGNTGWKNADSINIDDIEGKSVLIIADESHMASAKQNQFYKNYREAYEAKKENPDKYPNFHIFGISATPYDTIFSIQKNLKYDEEPQFAFDRMKTGANHTNIEKMRLNGRLPHYGEKNYSTWDNVPNNQIEAIKYELRKAKDYQKDGKCIIIIRCNSKQFEQLKKELVAISNIVYRSFMSDTKDADTYAVDQLIPHMDEIQNDGKIYCLRIDQSYTEGCRIETDAIHSKVITVLESEKTTYPHTIVQHIGRWCGYNKSHHNFPIYTHNNNDCINEHTKIITRLENCQHNEFDNIIRDTITDINTKYSKNNNKAVRRVFEIDKDINITEDLYDDYYEKTNGHKLQRMTPRTHCPEANMHLRRSGSGFEEDIFFSEVKKLYDGIRVTTSSVNAEALGGNHYIFDLKERLHHISILKRSLKQVKEKWATIKNSSNNALEYKDFNSDKTQKSINKILSISDLEKIKGECCFQKTLLVAERFVDGIKYNRVIEGRSKGMEITEKLINFKKGKQRKYNKQAVLQINECIEKNSNKTRIWLIIEVAIILESMHIECTEDMTEFILKNYPQLENDKKLLTVRYHNVDLGKNIKEESIFHDGITK